MFGINGGEFLVILVLAIILLGPTKLPVYAAKAGRLVRQGRAMLVDAKARVSDELGPDFREDDWRKLDPRAYDPRRIVREALADPDTPTRAAPSGASDRLSQANGTAGALGFDDEAT